MFLYIIYNKLNGKMYVGITNDPIKRWKRHKSCAKSGNLQKMYAIHHAMNKYNVENFIFKIIEELPNLNSALEAEIKWIKLLKDMKYQLYNETNGGEGGFGIKWTDERKEKMSILNSGKGNPMYGKQLFGAANGNYGKKMKPHVKETLKQYRRKLSEEQVDEIRKLHTAGNTQTSLSKQFNVSLSVIHRIVHNQSWSVRPNRDIKTKKNLTEQDIIELKKLYANGNCTQKDLCNRFNLSKTQVYRILAGKRWGHIKI